MEHGAEGDKDLVHVPAVVAGVLVFGRHNADDGVGNVVEDDRLADGRAAGKELLLDVAAEESHAPARFLITPVVESARLHADGANFGEGRVGAGHRGRGIVVKAAYLRAAALEFRQNVAAGGGFLLNGGDVVRRPSHLPAGPQTARLHARPPLEEDHQILGKGFLLPLLADAQAFASRHHQGDGNDPPGDPKHGQEGAQLVGPKVRRVSRSKSVKIIVLELSLSVISRSA